MKSIDLDPAIQADPGLFASVRRANDALNQELGRSTDSVSAAWKLLHDDRGRPLLKLAISDWTGRVETVFAPADLKSDWETQGRLLRLWGDLLQVRSHKLLEEMQAASVGTDSGGV